jgi:hypothetical protein
MLPKFLWHFCKDTFAWNLVPENVEQFQEGVQERSDKKTKSVLIFLFGCVSWSLWLIRNDFVFNNIVISAPEVGIYHFLSFMQRWRVLCKGKDRLQVDIAVQNLQLQLAALQTDDDRKGSSFVFLLFSVCLEGDLERVFCTVALL